MILHLRELKEEHVSSLDNSVPLQIKVTKEKEGLRLLQTLAV